MNEFPNQLAGKNVYSCTTFQSGKCVANVLMIQGRGEREGQGISSHHRRFCCVLPWMEEGQGRRRRVGEDPGRVTVVKR